MKVQRSHEALNIGMSTAQREATAQLLTAALADEFILYVKERNAHWNVRGNGFHALHEVFEKHYSARADLIDEIAERIRALGYFAIGTTAELAAASRLKEHGGAYPDQNGYVAQAVADHEEIIRTLRAVLAQDWETTYNDPASQDLLTEMLAAHEKEAWLLRSFLDK